MADSRSGWRQGSSRPVQMVEVARIARRFYLDHKSKVEIAEEFGLSRHKVARSLRQARENGLVRISIDFPGNLRTAVADQLAKLYRLRRAVVVDTPDRDTAVAEPLGRAGAQILAAMVQRDEILGLDADPALGSLAAQISNLAACSVVHLTGTSSSAMMGENSFDLIRRVTRANGGSAFPISAPMLLTHPDAATELRRQPGVRTALRLHSKVTTAVVTIGSWATPDCTILAELAAEDRNRLIRQGVVAEICTTMIDRDGRIVSTSLSDRSISISTQQLAAIPNLIAVAGGPSKRLAVKAALATGLINILVTDLSTAHYLLGIAVGRSRT